MSTITKAIWNTKLVLPSLPEHQLLLQFQLHILKVDGKDRDTAQSFVTDWLHNKAGSERELIKTRVDFFVNYNTTSQMHNWNLTAVFINTNNSLWNFKV